MSSSRAKGLIKYIHDKRQRDGHIVASNGTHTGTPPALKFKV